MENPKKAGVASTAAPAPKLLRCTVRENNRYGYAGPGEVVEVTAEELDLCRHALIGPDETQAKAEAAKAKDDADAARLRALEERRAALFAARDAAIEGRRLAKARRAERLATEAAE